ncbi:hypothetical protein AB0N26_27920 [Streptomyces cellulosae]
MTWRRTTVIPALAVCVVVLAGSAGCDTPGGQGADEVSSSPVGRLLDERAEDGSPYREVDEEGAPQVTVEVAPDADGGWDVRLRVRNFRFSPDGTGRRAEAGRGLAHLKVNGRRVAVLRTPEYHLAPGAFPRGTHQVTARLYADDGSVWAVDGEPVESTADITVSGQEPTTEQSVAPLAEGPGSTGGPGQA